MSEIWFSVCKPWESALDKLKDTLALNYLDERIQFEEYREADRSFLFINMQDKNGAYVQMPELVCGVLCEDIAKRYLSVYCSRWLKLMLNEELERFLARTGRIKAQYDLQPSLKALSELIAGGRVNLDGFFRFRMRDLKKELERRVDIIAQDIILEREYFDFLDLIKEYSNSLCLEKKSADMIYLSGEESGLKLYDEEMRPIEWIKSGLPKEATQNDVILNTLIETAPNSIILCGTINTDDPFIEAVLYLFGEKIKVLEPS